MLGNGDWLNWAAMLMIYLGCRLCLCQLWLAEALEAMLTCVGFVFGGLADRVTSLVFYK